MKIKERAKKFVKEHKKEIVTVGTIIGGVTIFRLGIATGTACLFNEMTKKFGVDLRGEIVYNKMKDGMTVKDVLTDDILPDVFKKINLNSLDDEIKGVLIIKKK